jgi:hypothetical protein
MVCFLIIDPFLQGQQARVGLSWENVSLGKSNGKGLHTKRRLTMNRIAKMSRATLGPFAAMTLATLACFAPTTAQGATTLTAVKVDTPPALDGKADDNAWQLAGAVTLSLDGGVGFNGGSTQATVKAVYSGDMLYMLVTYDDPTDSVRRSPYVKQADGSWKKLKDPDDQGGDNNKYYEDKAAFIWNINQSIKNFDRSGCMTACHAGEAGKPYGNKYTRDKGELGDIWHLKMVRTGSVGQCDDQYLDDTRFDPDKTPEAGRKSDAKTGGGYKDIALVGGKPEFMHKDGKPANAGGAYHLNAADKVAFDDGKFKPGDEVASMMVAPFTGDRGDIACMIAYGGGKRTVELSRKLNTGSPTDVQFDNLDAAYPFGLATFDNAQVRHAFAFQPVKLVFGK